MASSANRAKTHILEDMKLDLSKINHGERDRLMPQDDYNQNVNNSAFTGMVNVVNWLI
jgi:hypothetical protein